MMFASNRASLMPEIVEAVHLTYEDFPDVEVDCLLFLKELCCGDGRLLSSVDKWFEEHDKCRACGSNFESYTYREPHPELDDCPEEVLTDWYCPICDGGGISD